MTLGCAKPRSELPWLPYESLDRVIINSHNFTPATWSPAVNGKMPVSAWVPSRDTAGNGTTTLSDLVGTNNGTLSGMDPATDWVSDTASGGVRALDFDEINDRVVFGDVSASQWTWGCWFKMRSLNGFSRLWSQDGFMLEIAINSSGEVSVYDGAAWRLFGSAITLNTWLHVCITYNGSSLRAYLDGTQRGSTLTAGRSMSGLSYMGGSFNGQAQDWYDGRIDDVRFWNEALALTDVAAWYAASRGGQA